MPPSRLRFILCSIPFFGLISCSTPDTAPTAKFYPAETVSREETIAIAEAYRSHLWTPEPRHIFHGNDRQGIRIDTPDEMHRPTDGSRPGWWIAGATNIGMPYKWGGFETPQSFDQGLADGKYAGDLYSEEKRRQLYSAVSDDCVGIDCSGFISRCWRLDRPYSTRQLPQLCDPLASFQDLKKGDIANKVNAHVLLFEYWTNRQRTHFVAYETGSPPTWKVVRHTIEVEYIKQLGYTPYRYKNIRED